MQDEFQEIIMDTQTGDIRYCLRQGFMFTRVFGPARVYDTILIKNPPNTPCFCPTFPDSQHTLDEQIAFINEHRIKKAMIIAESLDFIAQCPSLEYLSIIPSDNAGDKFDYSPLYAMTNLKSLACRTNYGKFWQYNTSVDFSFFPNLEDVTIEPPGDRNYNKLEHLKSLGISGYKEADLTNMFSSTILDSLMITKCKIKSLEGIQRSEKMQCLYLYYNRSLQDISALRECKKTLRALRIDNCPYIKDFSVLAELENLELLELTGGNQLESLDFIRQMKSLKTFIFSMPVLDGDLTPCLSLSYVYTPRSRKHYNVKNKDLPRVEYAWGNDNIEPWRRFDRGK